MVGPDIVHETSEKIRVIKDKLLVARSRQKSYADNRRRDLEFEVGDKVFLKISPYKGIMRYGKKGKLAPRYVGPYEIMERVGNVAYRVILPTSLQGIHNVFHVSVLRKYQPDSGHVLAEEELNVQPNLAYEEHPIKILDRREKVLRRKKIGLVKVLWKNHGVEEATWELEDKMRNAHPYLF